MKQVYMDIDTRYMFRNRFRFSWHNLHKVFECASVALLQILCEILGLLCCLKAANTECT